MLARPETARRAPPSRSVPARPKLFFQWELFSAIVRELPPLFKAHYNEIALNKDIPLEPDFDRYLACETARILHILTARRTDNGRLVGYVFGMIGPHLHYASSTWCLVDMYWLAPEFRKGWSGVRMFKAFEAGAVQLGAKVIMVTEKTHFAGTHPHGRNTGALFDYLRYDVVETVHSKRIG